MRNRFRITFAAAALLALTSCQHELTEWLRTGNNIRIFVSDVDDSETRSAEETSKRLIGSEEICSTEDGGTVSLYQYESDYVGSMDSSGKTRGLLGNLSRLKTVGNNFKLNAWLGSKNRYDGSQHGGVYDEKDKDNYNFISDQSVTYKSSGVWQIGSESTEIKWRKGVPTSFWGYYPTSLSDGHGTRTLTLPGQKATDNEQKELKMTYSIAAGSADKDDALKQEDLMFAYNLKTWNDDSDHEVSMNFKHALAIIRFDIEGTLAEEVTVNEVFFEGVSSEAVCTVTGTGENGISFSWVPTDGKTTTCRQAYDESDFTLTSLSGTTDDALQDLTKSSKLFFLVPQEVSGKVKIGLKYTRSGGSEHEKTIDLTHSAWQPGKVYTYKLATEPDNVDVDVSDEMDGFTKQDLKIKNTGNANAYIRVLIVGAYIEDVSGIEGREKNSIVYPWSPDDSDLGVFTGLPGAGWVKGDDEYYYYKTPVAPGETTATPLFISYQADFMPPVADSYLQIEIVGQAVPYDKEKKKVKAAWGEDAAALLETE